MGKDFEIDKLTGSDNYHAWSFAERNYLIYKGYGDCITLIKGDNDEMVIKEKNPTKLASCLAAINLSIDKSLYGHVQNCDTAYAVWMKLKSLFEDTGLARKIGLLKTLINVKLEDCESMQNYVDQIKTCSNKLTDIGFDISEDWQCAILLAGLTELYRPLIMAIEASNIEMKVDTIISKLIESEPSEKKTGAGFFNKKGKNPRSSKLGKKNGNGNRPKPKCYNCGRTNHLVKDCRAPKADDRKSEKKSSENSNNANTAFSAFAVHSTSTSDWFVDSGACSHMTSNEEILSKKRKPHIESITSANNGKLAAKSAGDTLLTLSNTQIPVYDVLHVPGIAANLLSVSKIVEKGNSVIFDQDGCTIKNSNNEVITNTKCENGVYRFQNVVGKCLMSTTDDKVNETLLWHRKLGHINFNSMRKMRDGAVDGIKFDGKADDVQNCEVCCEGKMHRLPFPTSETRSTKILELVHSDLMGPMETPSIGKARYILTFLDDFTKKVFVYFLKTKSDVLDIFKDFKKMVENQSKETIMKIRTDNGTEYCSNDFERFCRNSGTKHERTNAYTPQQNGMAERMNRTLVEKAKCLLFDAKLPKSYWAEAVHMAAYLINRSVNSSGLKTPNELFDGKKPDLSNLKIFGSTVMVHIPKENRRKWDKKAQKLVFVGYDEHTKGYRCMNRNTNKLVISRDVKFIENPQTSTMTVSLSNSNDNLHITEAPDHNTTELDDTVITISDDSFESAATDSAINNEESILEDTTLDAGEITDPNDADYEPSMNESFQPVVTRPQRERKEKKRFSLLYYAFLAEPQSFTEATTDYHKDEWGQAMVEEIESHRINNSWSLTDLPPGRKSIKSKWVYKLKRDQKGNVIRHKARLVAKGCSQTYGVDYTETFSPVVRYVSVRFLFALAVKKGLQIHQMDAITAYLHGEIQESIFMEQPEGFSDGSKRVCKLNRAIYGLKQAGMLWNAKLDAALLSFGLQKSKLDPCIYFSCNRDMMIAIYVDDFLIFYNSTGRLKELKIFLNKNFRMKDVGPVVSCLGMRITQRNGEIWIDQQRYTQDILERFGMENCKPIGTPSDINTKLSISMVNPDNSLVGKVPYQEAVGSLLYLAQGSRPDIAFAVNDVSRFSANHSNHHWAAVKRIFRYLKGTVDFKLKYSRTGPATNLTCYVDSDWASDIDRRRSCGGHTILMSSGSVSWCSKRQATVALSSTEAEYMALSSAVCDVIWTQQLAKELDKNFIANTLIRCDNVSTINLAKSDAFRPRTKHIDIRYHYLREKVESKVIDLEYVPTTENVADMLTKAITKQKHIFCTAGMGLIVD